MGSCGRRGAGCPCDSEKSWSNIQLRRKYKEGNYDRGHFDGSLVQQQPHQGSGGEHQERECARKEEFCKPEFCPNGDLAPVPEGECCPSRDLCPLQHCQGISCPPKKCPTGDLAPMPRDSCCPSKAECNNKNCSQVRCIVERCDDGSIAPVPEGQCCPSKRACPAQAFSLEPSYSRGTDCTKVTCYLARCPGSNLVAPVPWGNCCPNIGLCPLTTRVLEDPNGSSPNFHQQSIESF